MRDAPVPSHDSAARFGQFATSCPSPFDVCSANSGPHLLARSGAVVAGSLPESAGSASVVAHSAAVADWAVEVAESAEVGIPDCIAVQAVGNSFDQVPACPVDVDWALASLAGRIAVASAAASVASLAVAFVVESARVVTRPTAAEASASVHIAPAVAAAGCWHSVPGEEFVLAD